MHKGTKHFAAARQVTTGKVPDLCSRCPEIKNKDYSLYVLAPKTSPRSLLCVASAFSRTAPRPAPGLTARGRPRCEAHLPRCVDFSAAEVRPDHSRQKAPPQSPVCAHVHTPVHTHVHTPVRVHTRPHSRPHTCARAHTSTHLCAHTHTCLHTYACTHRDLTSTLMDYTLDIFWGFLLKMLPILVQARLTSRQ